MYITKDQWPYDPFFLVSAMAAGCSSRVFLFVLLAFCTRFVPDSITWSTLAFSNDESIYLYYKEQKELKLAYTKAKHHIPK